MKRLCRASALALVVAGCGGTGASPTPAAVGVTLQEWAVSTTAASVPAGEVKFTINNTGPDDTHEFVVIKTDLDFLALPTDSDGAVDEAQGGMVVEGEVEDVLVGATEELTLTLQPGKYVLLCNIYDPDENEAHYQLGMRTEFTVNP